MELSVVIPAYQEAKNLPRIIGEIKQVIITLGIEGEILIIDSMQPMDETPDICLKEGVLHCPRENGNFYGDAVRTGIQKARGNYILMMDADGSHDPRDIQRIYAKIKEGGYTLVIGSRYCKGGSSDNSLLLKLMSWALNCTYRLFFNLPVMDVSNSYRIYDADAIKSLRLECKNFDIVEEILIKLKYTNESFSVLEVPISFRKRMAGESKRDLTKFIFSYLQTMQRLQRIKRETSRE